LHQPTQKHEQRPNLRMPFRALYGNPVPKDFGCIPELPETMKLL